MPSRSMSRPATSTAREAEAHLVKKDLGLFVESAGADDAPCPTIVRAYDTVAAFADSDPAQDMIRIYPFVRDGAS